MGYSFRLTARVLLYASSHRQDITCYGLCYTSRGALAGTTWCHGPLDCGMHYPVCGMVHIKDSLLLIENNSPCRGGRGFPLSLSILSFTMCYIFTLNLLLLHLLQLLLLLLLLLQHQQQQLLQLQLSLLPQLLLLLSPILPLLH